MDVAKEVRALANWPESGHLVISLYLNTRWSDEQRREKVRIFVKDRLKEIERDHSSRKLRWADLSGDVDWIRDYVDGLVAQHHDKEYDGIALFACGAEGLRTVFRSRIPFADMCHVGPRPRIRPLAHLYDEYEAALFCDVGLTTATLYLVTAGEVESVLSLENESPARDRYRGWSRERHGQRIDDHTERHLKEVADQIVRIVNREELRNVLLSGTERVVGGLRRLLPGSYDDMVIATASLGRNPTRDAVVAATVEALVAAERKREQNLVRQLLELSGNPDRAAIGLDAVLAALERWRVHRLLLGEKFERPGFRCLACGKLGERPPESCEMCGEPVISTDLAEAMTVAAIQRGGEVDEIVNHPEFEELGGVAALLRY
jgi:peptide subunit release factor 1 (eRF1)